MPSRTPPPDRAGSLPFPPRPDGGVGKVLALTDLLARRAKARRDGLRLVQCHGCFDIVHPGHIRHLRQAKAQGDLLLVTITGDAGVGKGAGRPLIPEELRAENLAAFDFVDWVYVEHRPTAADLLDQVRPDVYIKGREYEQNSDPRFQAERAAVERHGGRIVFSSGDVVFSSTALVAALERSTDPYHARLIQLLDHPDLDGPRLASVIASFRSKRILVVGEVITDTYVLCDRPDTAGEAPIMTLRPVERRTYDGGAAVIARHLAAMGALPTLVTVLPDSADADALRHRLLAEGVKVRAIPIPNARIPEKQRFLVGAQKVMKLDLVDSLVLDAAQQDALIDLATTAIDDTAGPGGFDAAIIADFGLGALSAGVLSRLCKALRPRVKILAGDVSGRRSHLRHMTGMDLLCPSESEVRESFRTFDEGLPTAAWNLLRGTASKNAIITMGAEGLVAFTRLGAPAAGRTAERPDGHTRDEACSEAESRDLSRTNHLRAVPAHSSPDSSDGFRTRVTGEHVPALCGHAIDALGCGDALLAAATLSLASGASLLAASFLGSLAAATQAQRLGNTVISAADLRHALARLHASHLTYAPPETIPTTRPVHAIPLTA